jgi:cytochrome c551/c552
MNIHQSIAVLSVVLVVGCSDENTPVIEMPLSPEGHLLAIKASCMGCHERGKSIHGPSIEEIAAKHQNSDLEKLAETVKRGKKSRELTWGDAPKPGSKYTAQDIKAVLEWMLKQG